MKRHDVLPNTPTSGGFYWYFAEGKAPQVVELRVSEYGAGAVLWFVDGHREHKLWKSYIIGPLPVPTEG